MLHPSSPLLTIFHTNDFHNHLTSAQALWLKSRIEREPGAKLVLDAGDAVASGNIGFNLAGESVYALMNEIGYDAMTIGNREFHFSRRGFRCKTMGANFPLLCANIRPKSQMAALEQLPTKPFKIFDLLDVGKVAVFGITVPMITEKMLSRKVSAFLFDNPQKVARLTVDYLLEKEKPDLLVALSHIGASRDRELAELIPELDLIVGGHSHTVIPNGEQIGKTWIVQTGSYAHSLGIVKIERGDLGHLAVLSAELETIATR